jgi:uncharacterized integral membrane protein (TIGR00698 family)
MVEIIKKEYKGFATASIIGVVAFFASSYTPSWLNSILLALLIGILIGNLAKIPSTFSSGITFTSSKMLELSVLFLAFSINFSHIAKLGVTTFLIIAFVVLIVLLFTYYFAIKVKCPATAGWLIGFGTAICGSSAIAALSPLVSKEKDSVGISMAVVNLFGTIGMLVMPFLLLKFHLSNDEMGMLLGGSLHSVGNVAGSAYSINNEVGETAITIKLARVALLSPGLLLFNFLVNRNNTISEVKSKFSLPWYLWSFIGITILGSIFSFSKEIVDIMELIGKIVLTIAMAAIGLKISFKSLLQSGKKGILFGLVMFILQFCLVLILMKTIK